MEEELYIKFNLGQSPYISDINLNQMQKMIKADIKQQIIDAKNEMQNNIEESIEESNKTLIETGEEFETNKFVNGKRVYGKIINCGQLPETGQGSTTPTGLSNVTYIGLEGGLNIDNSQFIPCNIYFNSNLWIGAFIQDNDVRINNNASGIRTGIVYITVYYTKN